MKSRFLILSLAAATLFTQCRPNNSAAIVSLQDRINQLEEKNAASRKELSALRQQYLKDLDVREREFQEFAAGVKKLNEAADGLRTTMQEFGDYKKRYRESIRKRAPGMTLTDIVIGSRVYPKVVVREVSQGEITVLHDSGSAKVPLSSLSQELQDMFAYDPTLEFILSRSQGTGTDWLLNAMTEAKIALENESDSTSSRPSTNKSKSNNARPQTRSSGYNAFAAQPANSSWWRGRSGFTGSYWAPMHSRKQHNGTVNSYDSGSFGRP